MKKLNLSTDHIEVFASPSYEVQNCFSITRASLQEPTSSKIAHKIRNKVNKFNTFVVDATLINFDDFQENVNQILDILSPHKNLQVIFVFEAEDKLTKVQD